MVTAPLLVEHSTLDSDRFGITVAKVGDIVASQADAVLEECRTRAVDLVVARCATSNLGLVHALEGVGFRLMDTLLTYGLALPAADGAPAVALTDVALAPADVAVAPAGPGDADAVAAVAARAFHGYQGHYHADPRLPDDDCDATYADWARRSVLSRHVADVVLVARDPSAGVVGFSTIRVGGGTADGALDAVDPDQRRRGLYRALSSARISWAQAAGCTHVTVSTQITNLATQAHLADRGFRVESSAHTLHAWLSAPP